MKIVHSALKVAYSSIVGQGIMLLNKDGACIAMLSVFNTEHPQEVAEEVVAAINTPPAEEGER